MFGPKRNMRFRWKPLELYISLEIFFFFQFTKWDMGVGVACCLQEEVGIGSWSRASSFSSLCNLSLLNDVPIVSSL